MSAKYTRLPTSEDQATIFDYTSQFDCTSQFESCKNQTDYSSTSDFSSAFKYNKKDHRINIFDNVGKEDKTKVDTFIDKSCRYFITAVSYVLLFLTLPFSLIWALKSVQQYERIVLFRLGKVQKPRGPGFVIILPWIDRVRRVDLRMRAFSVPPQKIFTQDNSVIEVGADVQYKVVDVLQSILHVQDLNHSTRVLGQTFLLNHLSKKHLEDISKDKPIIQELLQKELAQTTLTWGLEVSRVELSNIKVIHAAPPQQGIANKLLGIGQSAGLPAELLGLLAGAVDLPGGQMPHGFTNPQPSVMNEVSESEDTTNAPTVLMEMIHGVLNSQVVSAVGAIFKFVIDGSVYYLDAKNGDGTVGKGEPPKEPDSTLTLSLETLSDLMRQELSPLQAYLGGRLQITGDLSATMKLEKIMELVQNHAGPLHDTVVYTHESRVVHL